MGAYEKLPYIFYTLLLFLMLAAIILTPYLLSQPQQASLGKTLFHLFSPTCHQLPSRSLFIFERQMPVCSRCFSFYAGMFIGALAFPFVRKGKPESTELPPLIFLILAMIPMGLDGGLQLIGLWESTNELRILTGLILGPVVSFFLIPLINDLAFRLFPSLRA
ncbi:MAG: DUF2085 domain-containing protein [Candidatus Micrarchaeota archaeon]|nr:DUF2085 domain-containing protein [Candidatus Micrarchaeota archaeon]